MKTIERAEMEIRGYERDGQRYTDLINKLEEVKNTYGEITLKELRKVLNKELGTKGLRKERGRYSSGIYFLDYGKFSGIDLVLNPRGEYQTITARSLEHAIYVLSNILNEVILSQLNFFRKRYFELLEKEQLAS